MKHNSKISLIVAGLILASGGLAIAAPESDTIYACLASSTGNLSKVSTKSPKCPRGTSLISWSQSGPQGPQGPHGAKGPQGAKGAQGPQGVAGKSFQSREVTLGLSNGTEVETVENGKFLNLKGQLWPLDWGTGAFAPVAGAFKHNTEDGSDNTYEVLVYPKTNCLGNSHALISTRNGVSIEGTFVFPWTDSLPPVPVEGEMHLINGRLFKISKAEFVRESSKSWRDGRGVCRNTRPLSSMQSELYYYTKQENLSCLNYEYDYDLEEDVCFEYEVSEVAIPLFMVRATEVFGVPEVSYTDELLKLHAD